MESLSNSWQIKGFYRTQGKAIAPGKITIELDTIKTILGMTEEKIEKGQGNRSVGLIIGVQEPGPTSTIGKPSRDTDDFGRFQRRRGVQLGLEVLCKVNEGLRDILDAETSKVPKTRHPGDRVLGR
jgi:hypothetical protein